MQATLLEMITFCGICELLAFSTFEKINQIVLTKYFFSVHFINNHENVAKILLLHISSRNNFCALLWSICYDIIPAADPAAVRKP